MYFLKFLINNILFTQNVQTVIPLYTKWHKQSAVQKLFNEKHEYNKTFLNLQFKTYVFKLDRINFTFGLSTKELPNTFCNS